MLTFYLSPRFTRSNWNKHDLTTRRYLAEQLLKILVNPCLGQRLRLGRSAELCIVAGLRDHLAIVYKWMDDLDTVEVRAVGKVGGRHDPITHLRALGDLEDEPGHTSVARVRCCDLSDDERRDRIDSLGHEQPQSLTTLLTP